MKQIKFYILTFVLMVSAIALLLLALEVLLCWRSHRASQEERDHVVETDFLPVKFRSNYQGRMWNIAYSTNAYGFRDEPDFSEELSQGELRVFSMGDSIGFGVGLEAKEHYCKVAERQIRMNFPEALISIVNASGQGYSPSGYYVYLCHEGLKLKPGMIIVEIELCNDLTDEALLRWELNDEGRYPIAIKGGRYRVAWDGSLLGTYSLGTFPWERTYTYTDFIRRVLNLLNRVSPSPLFARTPGGTIYYSLGFDQYLLDQARVEEGWRRLVTAIEATNELCRTGQVPFLLLIMPSRYIFDDSAPDHRDLALSLLQRAESEIRSRGIPYINMSSSIEAAGGSAVFFDFAHLTAEGNRAVGETLAGYLSEMTSSAGEEPPDLAE